MGQERILHCLYLYQCFGIEYIEELTLGKNIKINGNLPNELPLLSKYLEHCHLCELSKISQTKSLGFGNPQSEFYFVGLSCDFQNEKFNSLLENMVEKFLNLSLEDIYFTNLLKCHTKFSKDENQFHINLCKEYFIKQIDIIRPKYIVAFGEVFHYLFPKEVKMVYGNSYKYHNSNLVPLLDLEFIYKNPSYQEDMYRDLQKFKILLGDE